MVRMKDEEICQDVVTLTPTYLPMTLLMPHVFGRIIEWTPAQGAVNGPDISLASFLLARYLNFQVLTTFALFAPVAPG